MIAYNTCTSQHYYINKKSKNKNQETVLFRKICSVERKNREKFDEIEGFYCMIQSDFQEPIFNKNIVSL